MKAPEKPIFILSFFATYWPMILLFVGFQALGHWDRAVYFFGPVFYQVSLMIAVLFATLLAVHIWFRRSVDAYKQEKDADGKYVFVKEFYGLLPWQRVLLTFATLWLVWIGNCIIAASIAK